MYNLETSYKYEQKAIKSALKKELPEDEQMFKRYDRKGRQITYGSKYEVTIDDQVRFLVPLDNFTPRSNQKSPLHLINRTQSPATKSPLPKSPTIEKSETVALNQKQHPVTSSKILELNQQEEITLKALESKFQKNKKIGKSQKQCCKIF